MSTIQVVKASDAPTPVSHFSQARIWNGVVYCSGDLGLDPKTNQLVDGTTTERTVRAPLCYFFFFKQIYLRKGLRRYRLFETCPLSWKLQDPH